jgi:hypothetical protein
MIQCPVCSHQNDELALLCASCGSYVQERVPTLDFFATMWMLVEYPGAALKKIVLAEHKNYVLMLAMFFGISVGYGLFWSGHAGNGFVNIAHLIIAASGIGLIIAIPLFYIMASLVYASMLLLGGMGSWRNTYAVVGWGLFPFSFATTIVLPIELAAFGLLFFSNNPHPYEVKPLVYSVLVGLDGLLTVWALVTGAKGLSLAHSISFWKSMAALVAVVAICMGALFLCAQVLLFAA